MSKTSTINASTSGLGKGATNKLQMKGRYNSEDSDSSDEETDLRVNSSFTTVKELFIGSDEDFEEEGGNEEGEEVLPGSNSVPALEKPEDCGKCGKKVTADQESLECEICRQPFHIKCEGINKSQYKQQMANKKGKKSSHFPFHCTTCSRTASNWMRQMTIVEKQYQAMKLKVDKIEKEKADKVEVKKLKQEIKEEVNELRESVKKLEENPGPSCINTDDVIQEVREQEERRNNLVLFNVEESKSHDTGDRIKHDKEEVKEIARICNVSIRRDEVLKAVRLGKKGENSRPLVVKLSSEDKKRDMLKNADKLGRSKYKKVGLQQDLTPKQKEKEKELKEEADAKSRDLPKEESGEYKYGVRGPPWARKVQKVKKRAPRN